MLVVLKRVNHAGDTKSWNYIATKGCIKKLFPIYLLWFSKNISLKLLAEFCDAQEMFYSKKFNI